MCLHTCIRRIDTSPIHHALPHAQFNRPLHYFAACFMDSRPSQRYYNHVLLFQHSELRLPQLYVKCLWKNNGVPKYVKFQLTEAVNQPTTP